jgi:hypothetical protein
VSITTLNPPETENKTLQQSREAIDRVVPIYREFLHELTDIVRGATRPLVKTDEDCEGADFAFCIEVKQADYERVVNETSALESAFYARYGVNFVVIPEVM